MSSDKVRVPTLGEIVLRMALFERKAVYPIWDLGLRIEHFDPTVQAAFKFIEKYRSNNEGKLPGDAILASEMGWGDYPSVRDFREEATFTYFAEMMRRNALYEIFRRRMSEVESMLRQGPDEVDKALETWLDLPDDIVGLRGGVGSLVVPVNSLYKDMMGSYDRYKAGEVGIDLYWKTLTDEALLQPGQNAWIVGRPGTGKTWLMLMLAEHMVDQGLKVLFVSPEVRGVSFAERHVARALKLNYLKLIQGKLDPLQEQLLRNHVEKVSLSPNEGVRVASSDFQPSREKVEAMIEREDPDVIFLDSVYLYGKGRSRGDVLASVAPWIVQLCSWGRQRNVFATAQLNRDAGDESSVTGDNIYGTDAILQDADVILGMIQSEQMRKDHQMLIKFLKRRRSTYKINEFMIEWDMARMSFEEIIRAPRVTQPNFANAATPGFDTSVPF